jgi:hypothetical protein
MPLVTVTVRKPKTAAFKGAVLAAIHGALVASGVPEEDRFHRVIELEAEDFRYAEAYPDLERPRDGDFILVLVVRRRALHQRLKRKSTASTQENSLVQRVNAG